MLTVVNIAIVLGIILNLSIYAYQKRSEKEDVNTDLDSSDLDTRVARNNVNSRKH
ncbi:hypothetical protein HCJ02_01930 [Listeria seeligeri]|uniref:Uncharacterized protein n=1 Tax=Listeria immobilis TaxID=2713502 RepID=A0ABR6SUU5_9LIST|nr:MULTISPECIES: hypothetical protein [Listeria]MBC1509448.1 hypothetical protein [Listeria immobilis]MBC1532093.1 hypothetical protein [Listeria seeligeri]MBC1827093.1 hypothetical protein [Listeria seeligeri]MBC1840113.1 hypothetical protein [Listeria seeligeri]MBC6141880.1 hypothetical protein [Listeria seeligeri]